MLLIKTDKNKVTEHRRQNHKMQRHQAIDTFCVEEKIWTSQNTCLHAYSCKAGKCIHITSLTLKLKSKIDKSLKYFITRTHIPVVK